MLNDNESRTLIAIARLEPVLPRELTVEEFAQARDSLIAKGLLEQGPVIVGLTDAGRAALPAGVLDMTMPAPAGLVPTLLPGDPMHYPGVSRTWTAQEVTEHCGEPDPASVETFRRLWEK